MKRAITGIAAASVALGLMAPAAFAATTSSTMQWQQEYISVSGQQTGFKGFAANYAGAPTNYMPIWYVNQALKNMGFQVNWDGTNLFINNSSITAPTNATPGSGPNGIYLNGVLVQKTTTKVAKDPASKVNTTYMPIYFVLKVLQEVGVAQTSNWNGTTLTMTAPTPVSTTAGFSNFTVSGAQQGNGTEASPAVSSNGGAISLSTTLTNGTTPAANTAVNLSISGTTGDTPVVEVNGSYVTATANSSNDGWTASVDTNSSGQLNVSVVGTGSYTVTATSASNSSVSTEGYVAFLGSNGLLTPNAVSGSGYSANISSLSNASAGVVPVTFTLPLNSSGDVQANTAVTFKVYGGSAFLSTSTGQEIAANGNTYTVYSNSMGQATIYVNDFNADSNVEVEAVVGANPTTWTNAATTYIDYSNPNSPSGAYALNNIGAFAFASSTSGASTSSASSVAGVPVTNSVYFAPVDTNGAVYNANDGAINYTLNATNGAYIGLSLNTGSATSPSFSTVTLPSSLSSDSSMTLQFQLDSAGTGYNVYANGIELTNSAGTAYDVSTPEFAANAVDDSNATGSGSTLTVTSGKVSAQADFVFSGSTPAYVVDFSPVVSNIGADGTENVTFQVVDSSGNPVKNQQVKIGLDANTAAQGLWITAVNGTQLTTPNGTGGTEYTPIPMDGSANTVANLTDTLVPGVANWSTGSNTFNAYTDANGDVTLTIQNGGVFAAVNGTNTAENQTSSTTVTAYTYTSNTSNSTPAVDFTYGGDASTYGASNQSQVGEITNN